MPALMEGVERMNVIVVRQLGQRMGMSPRRDPYAMKVDREKNCYVCREFGHMAYHCRNWRRER